MNEAPALSRSRPRVDAHVHLSQWWPEIQRTGYRSDLKYSVAGLLAEMDRNRLDFAITIHLFQAPSEGAALDEGLTIHSASEGRLLPVATVDPTKGVDSVQGVLDRIEREPHVFGIKLYPGYLPYYPTDARLDPVYEFARRRGLPVLFHQGDTLDGRGLLKYARPLEIDEVAGRFRDVRFVICHLGNPWISEAAEVVYKNPNVYADTSGLLPSSRSAYFTGATEQAREAIRSAVIASGAPERFLYGSDWPLEGLELAVDLIESLRIRPEDLAGMLGENAVRLFRIPGPWSGG